VASFNNSGFKNTKCSFDKNQLTLISNNLSDIFKQVIC